MATKYKLSARPLGRGGEADVFRAENRATGEVVAYKRAKGKSKDNMARIRHEIEVLQHLDHPNIMPVLDHDDSLRWYTMPIANQVLGNVPRPVDDEVLIEVMRDCANGLRAAHEQGIYHRDVTPNNIMHINRDGAGRWVVSDWGLVRLRGRTTIVRTFPQHSYGTEGFAPPEMWDDAHSADSRADIYGLGRVLAYCLTGKWPHPNIPMIPPGPWADLIEKATALDVVDRFQSMDEFLDVLSRRVFTSPKLALLEFPVANIALRALAQRDMALLAELAHPATGIRFSPYAFVSDEDKVLSREEIEKTYESSVLLPWGSYDGSGSPIEMSFAEYLASMVNADKFVDESHEIFINKVEPRGNTINNAPSYYPEADIVEYYHEGTMGMDWQSLRLVFEDWEGQPRLVGVIRDIWTI